MSDRVDVRRKPRAAITSSRKKVSYFGRSTALSKVENTEEILKFIDFEGSARQLKTKKKLESYQS